MSVLRVGKATVEVGDFVVVSGPRANWGSVAKIDSNGAQIQWIGSADDRDVHFWYGASAADLLDDAVSLFAADEKEAAHEAFLAAIQT